MRIFLSIPMRGLTRKQIEYAFNKLKTMVQSEIFPDRSDLEFIDTLFDFQNIPSENKNLWCLGESIKMLSFADICVMAPGWEDCRGCLVERQAALSYGIKVIEF